MKKNGFTLIELLGVMIIMAALAIIVIPTVDKAIKQGKNDLYDKQIDIIKLGLQTWGSDNLVLMPEDGEMITLTLSQLKQANAVDSNIKNPLTDKYFPNDMLLTIENENGRFIYTVLEDTGTIDDEEQYPDESSAVIVLNGSPIVRIETGTVYNDQGVTIKRADGTVVDQNDATVNVSIKDRDGNTLSIDTSSEGEYIITYDTEEAPYTKVVRTLIVSSTRVPILTIPDNIAITTDEVESFDLLAGASGEDAKGNPLEVTTSGSLSNIPMTYTITYRVSDANGVVTTKKRLITVVQSNVYIFRTPGSAQLFNVPKDGTYKIELWGANGGMTDSDANNGGRGGYTAGIIYLNADEKLYVYTGGKGATSGYNGGGSSAKIASNRGGGATDIRCFYNAITQKCEENTDNLDATDPLGLNSRIIVSGGGGGLGTNGGGATRYSPGGAGGGLIGSSGTSGFCCEGRGNPTTNYALGGTQKAGGIAMSCTDDCMWGTSNPGQFGQGGNDITASYSNGGGGGGYYGGASGTTTDCDISSAAGGSSYISGHIGCIAITGSNNSSPKAGCNETLGNTPSEYIGTTNVACSIHYSNKKFTDTVMIDGLGYSWTNVRSIQVEMPNPNGSSYNIGEGHTGDGHARITYIGP